jgi:uncharacterized MnhB-related membrane protein
MRDHKPGRRFGRLRLFVQLIVILLGLFSWFVIVEGLSLKKAVITTVPILAVVLCVYTLVLYVLYKKG